MQVSKLINALKRSYPELKDEPMLDELEAAASADPDAPAGESDDLMPSDDSDAQEAEPADDNGLDQLMPPLDEDGEDLPPPAKKRKAKNPFEEDAESDEPSDVNGKY